MTLTIDRRFFVAGAAGLALTGCDDIGESPQAKSSFDQSNNLTYQALRAAERDKLAPEYDPLAISAFFKPNGSIDPKDPAYKQMVAEKFAGYSMPVGGMVEKPRAFTLADLRKLPARTQITRHDCVEGWSSIARWTGAPLRDILDLVQPKPEARYVVFHCFDRYATDYTTDAPDASLDPNDSPVFYGSIGLEAAVHPQSILAYEMNGNALPVEHGAPLRLRVERQLGYKSTKYIKSIEVVASFAKLGDGKGGYWEDQGYQWYAGI